MLPLAYYLLKVIVCSAILFAYYWLFLRNKIFHRYNRFYLLAVIVLSLTLPLLKFSIWQSADAKQAKVIKMLQVVNSSDEYMDEVIIYSRAKHISKETIFLWIFIIVCAGFAAVFVRTILRINRLKKENPSEEYHGIKLISTNDKSTPFSFFKNIFWNNHINITSDSGYRILKHELAHVKEKHSHDKIFVNIVLIFFWCNPVFWLLRKELNLIHEFTADQKAVEDGDTAAFAAMILQTTYPRHQFELTNNFFYSPLKRRLIMLTKNNKKVNYLSRLLVLPLAFTVAAAFTFKSKTAFAPQLPADRKITVVLDAGHGGSDKGAYSTSDKLFEKDLTLALVKKIKSLNTDASINFILLRESDVYQSPQEKAKLANSLHPDLFISIHGDATSEKPETEKSGAHVLVAKDKFANVDKSKVFASAIISSLQSDFGLPVAANPMQQQNGIWILQESKCPAVLIEAAYMNNKKDVAYITSENGQMVFAKKVLEAISNYAANVAITKNATSENKLVTVDKTAGNEVYQKPVFHFNKDSVIDASQYASASPDENKDRHGIIIRGNEKNVSPTYVLDGEEISEAALKNLDLLNANVPLDEHRGAGTFVVMTKFIVAKDGTVKNVETENYKGTKTARMCIDFIKNGPKWIPGKQNGKTVNSVRKQPITFVIEE